MPSPLGWKRHRLTHPTSTPTSRKFIVAGARLAEALNHPAERDEAADAIRELIECVTLTPGPKRGQVNATLRGEFGAILEWIEWRERAENQNTPGAFASGVSVSVVAGTGFEPVTFRL